MSAAEQKTLDSGHDARVVGEDPVVVVDRQGAREHGR
jgi:hypothetical protein